MEEELEPTACLSRRELLKRGLLTTAGLVFFDPRRLPAQAPKPAGRAKSVIQIWMWGGPCHIDTFDPKPGAGYDYCGPLDKPIGTNVAGIQIGQLLPLLARQADQYSLIRSMTHGNNGHETASYLLQTGHQPDRLSYPCVGAVVALFKGRDYGYQGLIPPYVVLTQPQGRFSEAGFLGPNYKPFATGGDPNLARFVVEGVVAEGVSDERQQARRDLLHDLDTLGAAMPGCDEFKRMNEAESNAYDLILGDSRKLFDLGQEKPELRERYGRNKFGQSCLMARRLVESGIPYVTINYNGWDTHKQHFQTMNRKLPEFDRGLATLLADLKDHGLLDSTIVWCCGEFGRTPKVQWEAPWNGGRGHFGAVFSALVAGGGFKGGHLVGASDAKGMEVAERPVSPQDLIGTMHELLGIDPQGALPNPRGLDVKVLPPQEKNPGAGRLKEIV